MPKEHRPYESFQLRKYFGVLVYHNEGIRNKVLPKLRKQLKEEGIGICARAFLTKL